MSRLSRLAAATAALLFLATSTFAEDKSFPHFRAQEIDKTITVGYGVLLVDLNMDGKPDIVVVDSRRVIWFENPTWKMHTILAGQTIPDNVCIDAIDIDGDGKPDLVLGAGWKGYNTKEEGTIQWLQRGSDVTQPWTAHPIAKEVDIHRIHVADVEGTGKPQIFVAPLLGKGATQADNWMDVSPRLLMFRVPADPMNGKWEPAVAWEKFHVMHNFSPIHWNGEKEVSLLVASYEGVHLLKRQPDGTFSATPICAGNQENPNKSRGTSEVKLGRGPGGKPFIAAIEPWHGNQVVVYTPPDESKGAAGAIAGMWQRHVIDSDLQEGHGVSCADLDGDGIDEIVVGSRAGTPNDGRGVFAYKITDASAPDSLAHWNKHVIDNTDMAAEDIAAIDLNGDGKIDIVASGRATHNVKIYWNEGK